MNKVIGVLAHVDAGKTTVTEQILAHVGVVRRAGRVDHRDAFMDHHAIERERGITVFSDQAVFDYKDDRYYWIDTPGHAELCAEMENVLPVLDYALLIISCTEGVESHTETVWKLLEKHSIPTVIFVNKCDRPDADTHHCLNELKSRLSATACDFSGYTGDNIPETVAEAAAVQDDDLLEQYLSGECDTDRLKTAVIEQFKARETFPVFFGAALRDEGIAELMDALSALTVVSDQIDSTPFSARAFKVRRDEKGQRRLYLRINRGRLSVRDSIQTSSGMLQVSGLSIAHGGKYMPIQSAKAGEIVCVNGFQEVHIGDGVGAESGTRQNSDSFPLLEVSVTTDAQINNVKLLEYLRILEDEDPSLAVQCGSKGQLSVRVRGAIEMQILERNAMDRFGIRLIFGKPNVVFMESVLEPGEGVGHYEPLRHYAEVRLRVFPAPRGSGIEFVSRCHVDQLALNWQRLIETHIFERTYPGVLIGAQLTDVRIELINGRAHLKHTEGGDFREATCRALRCALMNAVSVLLEPTVRLNMRFQEELYGRIMEDMHAMHAEVDADIVRTPGYVEMSAVCTMRAFLDYPVTFRSLTHGRGILSVSNAGYIPARNAKEYVEQMDYDPRGEDTPDSVFCSHGAGHLIRWDEVPLYAHTETIAE